MLGCFLLIKRESEHEVWAHKSQTSLIVFYCVLNDRILHVTPIRMSSRFTLLSFFHSTLSARLLISYLLMSQRSWRKALVLKWRRVRRLMRDGEKMVSWCCFVPPVKPIDVVASRSSFMVWLIVPPPPTCTGVSSFYRLSLIEVKVSCCFVECKDPTFFLCCFGNQMEIRCFAESSVKSVEI